VRSRERLIAVLILAAMPAAPAAARDIFVNNMSGDEGATGRHAEPNPDRTGPVMSIAKALRLAERGDRIVLAKTAQPYRESITLAGGDHSGFSHEPFVVQGSGATLDGSAPVPRGAWEFYRGATFRFRPPHLEHQQLFLGGRPVPRVIAGRVADRPPELKPLEWCLHEEHIYFCVEPTKLPDDYALSYADKRVGITLFHVQHVAILDLTVQGFQLDGINAFNSAKKVHLEGVTCRGNGRSGIVVGGASLVDIEACLVGNNGVAQLLSLPLSETHVRNSDLLGNTAPAWVDQGGRVYVGPKQIEGGLEAIKPDNSSAEKPEKPESVKP
jgi:hypothetical protein